MIQRLWSPKRVVLLLLGLVVAMMGCADAQTPMVGEQAQQTDSSVLGELAAARFDDIFQSCMRAQGFSVELRDRSVVEPPVDDAADYGLGISTRHFRDSILPQGVLGEDRPDPIPTPDGARAQTEAEFTARSEADSRCTDEAAEEAAAVLSVDITLEPDIVSDLETRANASAAVVRFRDEASACVALATGNKYTSPDSAIEFFERAVASIGPSESNALTADQIARLAELQEAELKASNILDSCGWGVDYQALLSEVLDASEDE